MPALREDLPTLSPSSLVRRPNREPDTVAAPTRKRVLMAVTPFCSPNYTYPAPAYLTRFLRKRGHEVAQADFSLELMLRIFSRSGLERVFAAVEATGKLAEASPATQRIMHLQGRYLSTVDQVIRYLQGRDSSVAYRLCQRDFVPRGENFEKNKGFDSFDGSGNTLAVHDRAKFIGTQYLYDLAGLIREAIFPYFQITLVDRLYDSFVHWCGTFDRMEWELERPPNVVDQMLNEAVDAHLERDHPDVVGVSVPFARNLYWALRIGRRTHEWRRSAKVVAGGGLFNTSMRHPNEPRLFKYIDYLTLDDGERPMLNIVEHLEGRRSIEHLKRTFFLMNGEIQKSNGCPDPDITHAETGAADYDGYHVNDYFATLETTNINQRVRSDGWWNKMTMAHGCYWKKCSFCDIHLSYIGDYHTASARNLVDKVEECIAQTGSTGFHFVDEALPPKIMRDFAIELLKRDLNISWHGMLRFDKTFTLDFCRLLAASGLVAIFGGLEVASNRLLDLMKKGTSVEQVAVVAKNFQDAGTRVHAYLMYGFPTQTEQETVDALDVVRQLFKHRVVTSASWAKFGVTPHSPIGREPHEYGIELAEIPDRAFIEQIIPHKDPTGADHEKFSAGLQNSMRYFSLGMHHDSPSEHWFDFPVPAVSIDRDLIGKVLAARQVALETPEARNPKRIVWPNAEPSVRLLPEQPGELPQAELVFHAPTGDEPQGMPVPWARFLHDLLARARPAAEGPLAVESIESTWATHLNGSAPALTAATAGEPGPRDFKEFSATPLFQSLCNRGLTLI